MFIFIKKCYNTYNKNMFKSSQRKKIEFIYKIIAVLIAIAMIAFLLIPLLNA